MRTDLSTYVATGPKYVAAGHQWRPDLIAGGPTYVADRPVAAGHQYVATGPKYDATAHQYVSDGLAYFAAGPKYVAAGHQYTCDRITLWTDQIWL